MRPRVNAFRYRRERRQGRQVREVAGRVRRAGVVVAVAETGAVAGSGVARTEEWVCRRLVHGSRAWLLRPRHSRRRALVPVCALGGEVRELVMVQHPENSRARGCEQPSEGMQRGRGGGARDDGNAGVARAADPAIATPMAGRGGVRRGGPRSRIVSGFGPGRVDDVVGEQEQREQEALRRARRRRDEGTRGAMRGLGGEALDRGAGGAWRAGPR